MMDGKSDCAKGAASLLMRISVASIFIAAAVSKLQMEPGQLVSMFQGMFKETWLPAFLVTPYAASLTWIEVLIPIWLLSGFRLKFAWFFTGLVLISLAFGMMVVKNIPVATGNYIFVLMCCAGLYFSGFDCLQWGCRKENNDESAHVHGASCKH